MGTIDDRHEITSYDASWEKWRTEQVETITQILAAVFKLEEEARQLQTPSRLLKCSSTASSKSEEEIRQKLIQIRQQISEYKQLLKIGLTRVNLALEKMEAAKPSIIPVKPKAQATFFLKKWMKKLFSNSSLPG